MLLLHQIGTVHVGEVARYTLTYTPSLDRILPPPSHLHVKVKNTSAIPLRAAYLHGPYTLYVACYPSTFDPNQKYTRSEEEGEPSYEPQLKAGGQWYSTLKVPEAVREDASATVGHHQEHEPRKTFTWIIEVASQVLFSTTAAVHYELLVGRDEKSVSLGLSGVVSAHGAPGRLEDHQLGRNRVGAHLKGVFTKAVKLQVDDTRSLWNTPAFPVHDQTAATHHEGQQNDQKPLETNPQKPRKRRKKIHLVIITHGLHSNLGADMLYMKESIDVTARQAREDAKYARHEARQKEAKEKNDFGRGAARQRTNSAPDLVVAPTPDFDQDASTKSGDRDDNDDQEENEEDIIVRGFNGNAVRTEKGIQYLGKRLAKYVLSLTYPDQPYLPVKSTITQSISRTFTGAPKPTETHGRRPSHKGSSIAKDEDTDRFNLAYQITSISFIGHSLGGLVQTYAIAYIQKHSPEFFNKIRPINFVAMATPFLGLSNENPMYVKFALDFGLVGRTGQDLGLTWRAPTIARNGWGAMVGGLGDSNKDRQQNPGAKPLLRILPTGPAHVALKKFRNRSVYSNVVNDGIVPLRTSCLLFLDWRGLGRVEKARRENGLVGTMVNWGLNELIGHNASNPRKGLFDDFFADSGDEANKHPRKMSHDSGTAVPQADAGSGLDKDAYDPRDEGSFRRRMSLTRTGTSDESSSSNIWSTLTSFFRPQAGDQKQPTPKQQRIYQRGQIMGSEEPDAAKTSEELAPKAESQSPGDHRKLLVRGSSLYTNSSDNETLDAPPRTTVFESAGDLLNPPLPPKEFLLDPAARPRTIFHDRVYHAEDIPPPPAKRQKTFGRSRPGTSDDSTVPDQGPEDSQKTPSGQGGEQGTIRIEEKIARAYHKDLAWRKVLVRLEPDAHNNIIVRRMFANAYGWPVVKHMCDTHFGYTAAATTADEDEAPVERAKPQDVPADEEGEEVNDQTQAPDQKAVEDPNEKRAATTDHMPRKDDEETDTFHPRQRHFQAAKTPAKAKPRAARTHSEARESKDEVPDLVSMVSPQGEPNQNYSSMHSGTAALNRLVRQDSARWSDKFFDSTDEEEDEDENDLNSELQKAYDRGIIHDRFDPSPRSTRSVQKGGTQPVSAKSILPESEVLTRLVSEPDEMSRRNSRESLGTTGLSDSYPLRLSSVGLGRSAHEATTSLPDANEQAPLSPDIGITERVARARSHSNSQAKRPDVGERKETLD